MSGCPVGTPGRNTGEDLGLQMKWYEINLRQRARPQCSPLPRAAWLATFSRMDIRTLLSIPGTFVSIPGTQVPGLIGKSPHGPFGYVNDKLPVRVFDTRLSPPKEKSVITIPRG